MKVFGLVLAGGRSSRFGAEKAAAAVAGRPMIAWVLDVLERGCVQIAVNAKPGMRAAQFAMRRGVVCLPDDPAVPEGPLAGVLAGLAWAKAAGADAIITAPCDTPFLPMDMVRRLTTAADAGAEAAVVRTDEGLEPLCALWKLYKVESPRPLSGDTEAGMRAQCNILDAETLISQAFTQDRHPAVRDLLVRLGAVEVMFPDAQAFANVNTPIDYAEAVRSDRAKPE